MRQFSQSKLISSVMITEDSTLIDKFISVPKDMHGLNCAALVGGIVEGMLDGAEFV